MASSVGKLVFLFFLFCSSGREWDVSAIFFFGSCDEKRDSVSESTATTVNDG